jgi:hypothetical protein
VSPRVDSSTSIPTTTVLLEEPTSDAVFQFKVEKLSGFKGTVTVRLPWQRAELLVKIMMVLVIAFSPPLLLWATRTTLPIEYALTVLGFQFITLLLLGALSGRERTGSKK